MSLFEPQQDGLSRQEVVYRAIRDRTTGDQIAWSEMPFGYDVLKGLRSKVSKLMEREQKRMIIRVPGEGWQIVAGEEHVAQAERMQRQATRRQGRTVQIAQTVDRRELSGEGQLRADNVLIKAVSNYANQRSNASRRLGIEDVRAWRDQRGGAM